MEIFDRVESAVRSYSREFPAVFDRAVGSRLWSVDGRQFIDFFSGAGTLNYGHNNPVFKECLFDYLRRDGITHGLDMATAAKGEFLARFEKILAARGLSYKVQFTGPTGANAVEAALKLARKVTGRTNVLYSHNAYHGLSLGALAVTGNAAKRRAAGVPLLHTTAIPFEGDLGGTDTLDHLAWLLDNPSSGIELPAAAIVETVQAEGGVRVASFPWLRRLAGLLRERGILLIVDDIQVGCGRTGTFFSFEPADLAPDLVCLSKSISGYGLPMALVLIKPHLDLWSPGEHNGTFRGNNLAFVTAAAALAYWENGALGREVKRKGNLVDKRLREIAASCPEMATRVRGRGLIQGLELPPGLASQAAHAAFAHGLIIESVGPRDEVLKILPPLIIDDAELEQGLAILGQSLDEVLATPEARRLPATAGA
jgi:diaminobutyrate-2-oxoglutarate transaminase